MEIQDLIKEYSELIFNRFNYIKGGISLNLLSFEGDKNYSLNINTQFLYLNFPTEESIAFRMCNLHIDKLADNLEIKNDIFIASASFGQFMYESKNGFKLAYGLSAKKYKYLFSIRGVGLLFSCVVEKETDILIKEEIIL